MSGTTAQDICSLLNKPEQVYSLFKWQRKRACVERWRDRPLKVRRQVLSLGKSLYPTVFISKQRSIDLTTSNILSLIFKVTLWYYCINQGFSNVTFLKLYVLLNYLIFMSQIDAKSINNALVTQEINFGQNYMITIDSSSWIKKMHQIWAISFLSPEK